MADSLAVIREQVEFIEQWLPAEWESTARKHLRALVERLEQAGRLITEIETMAENHQANVDQGDAEGWHVGAVSYQRGLAAGLRTAADELRAAIPREEPSE